MVRDAQSGEVLRRRGDLLLLSARLQPIGVVGVVVDVTRLVDHANLLVDVVHVHVVVLGGAATRRGRVPFQVQRQNVPSTSISNSRLSVQKVVRSCSVTVAGWPNGERPRRAVVGGRVGR